MEHLVTNQHVVVAASDADIDARRFELPAEQFTIEIPGRFRRIREQIAPDDPAFVMFTCGSLGNRRQIYADCGATCGNECNERGAGMTN